MEVAPQWVGLDPTEKASQALGIQACSQNADMFCTISNFVNHGRMTAAEDM